MPEDRGRPSRSRGALLRLVLGVLRERLAKGKGLPPLKDWWRILRRLWAVHGPRWPGSRGRALRRTYAEMLRRAQRVQAGQDPCYVPAGIGHLDAATLALKAVAFYLPQFHPIPENDAWWGKGFTEWTNVSKAVPQFEGHYQPHLPGELGFYDLRLPGVMRRQVELARQYGLQGFCFHHYWFNGKSLLDLPLKQFLGDHGLDLGFCLCWANENWSRRWDGAEDELLIAQSHSSSDDLAFFASILPALRDPRYLTVAGRPLLMVYRVSLLPDPNATAQRWRRAATEAGLPGLYLVAARSFEVLEPGPYGFDAVAEYPPHQMNVEERTHLYRPLYPDYWGRVYEYRDLADYFSGQRGDGFTNLKTVAVSWDNESRRPGRGNTYTGSTPALYAQWLKAACDRTLELPGAERILFINAWNEWAEGAHLEPDRRFGYGYLEAGAEVLKGYRHG